MALPDIKVRVTAETGSLDSGLNSATASLNRFNKTSQQVAQQMGGMARSTDAAAGSVSNIAFQFQDIAMMMASGQSPFVLAMQQGTQLAGVLNTMKNPIAGLGAAFLQVLNPVSLVTIAAVGLGAAAVQAFMNTGKSAEEANVSLDGHAKRVRDIITGYGSAEKAASDFLETAKLLPQGAVTMQLGTELQTQLDQMRGKLNEVVAAGDEFTKQLEYYNSPENYGSAIEANVRAIDALRAETVKAEPDLAKILVTLTDLKNNAADETIASAAQEMYDAALAARQLEVQAGATDAALKSMAGSALGTAMSFGENIKALSGLYMDQRSAFQQARDSANESYQSALKASGGIGQQTAAAAEYKRVLDSINAAEAAAAAKAGAPAIAKGADKAAQLAEQVAQLQASLEGEVAVETAAYQKKMELLAQYYDGKDALMAERQQYEQLATQQHADKLAQIEAAARAKQMQQQQMMVSNVTSIMGSISQIIGAAGEKQIGIQKGISTAIAAINTAQGISKAFADYGWPGGLLPAAAIAAQGAAQIAAINSASRTGAQVASPAASGGSAQTAMNRTLTVQGITPGQIFSGDAMRDFMEQMLQMQRDGYQVVLA